MLNFYPNIRPQKLMVKWR